MVGTVSLGGRVVGVGAPCYVIAEAGVNHNGDMMMARQLVDAAVAAGADAVKFQTFRASTLVTAAAPKAAYQLTTTDPGESQFAMLKRLELAEEAHHALIAYCRERGIQFLTTPFDETTADLVASLALPVIKVPSGEVTNLPFLAHVGRTGQAIILSTGMATLEEVTEAVQTLRAAGTKDLVLLHCVSNYPADPAVVNLRAMKTLADTFAVPVGYSDHTMGNDVSLGAVAMGACVIEKHLTLDRELPGPDHRASAEPAEFAALVRGIRAIESALGTGVKAPAASEAEVARVARKSVVAARALAAGSVLTDEMLAVRRPGTGLAPQERARLVGRTLIAPLEEGALLRWDLLK